MKGQVLQFSLDSTQGWRGSYRTIAVANKYLIPDAFSLQHFRITITLKKYENMINRVHTGTNIKSIQKYLKKMLHKNQYQNFHICIKHYSNHQIWLRNWWEQPKWRPHPNWLLDMQCIVPQTNCDRLAMWNWRCRIPHANISMPRKKIFHTLVPSHNDSEQFCLDWRSKHMNKSKHKK